MILSWLFNTSVSGAITDGVNSPTSRITSPQDVEIDSRAEVMEVGTEDIIV